MSHMGGSGRRRGRAVAAVLLALCIMAPEFGSVAAGAATPSSAGSSASKPTSVVLVARRRSRSQVERARFRAYLKRHPNVMKNQIRKHPNAFARHLRTQGAKKKRSPYAAAVRKKNRKKHAARKRRRRGAAVAGAAAAKHKKGKNGNGGKRGKNKNKNSGKDLSWTDWAGIGLLVLAPFAAVALLLYITDLRRRPRAPSRTKRRRSLVITPHKS